jgi:predicted Na+-dependent transporter
LGGSVLSDALLAVTQLGMLGFVIASMIAMGLSLTVGQIVGSLRDGRVVGLLLAANFVAVPLAAIAAGRLLPMDEAAATAVIILGCCAGAPFLPKLAQLAKGDVATAVGGMVLLMVVTVGYAPVVLPLVVQGAAVDPLQIAGSLVLFMLIPLGLALLVRARYPEPAAAWAGRAGFVSTVSLLVGIAAGLLVSWQDILGSIGSLVFLGAGVLVVASLAFGYLAGLGRAPATRRVTMLGTGQRNIAAALVVAASLGGDVTVLTMIAGMTLVIVLILLAGGIGRRAAAVHVGDASEPSASASAEP